MASSLLLHPSHPDSTLATERLSPHVAEGPTARYLQQLLERAIQNQASDIHIHPWREGLSIRLRIDGLLIEEPPPPSLIADALPIRIKAMAGIDIAEKRQPQDGYWMTSAGTTGSQRVELRVSTLPSSHGENIVMRLVRSTSQLQRLQDLGMPPSMIQNLRELLTHPQGLILVTGPTGSGKSVTLYALLRELHASSRHILTIEDPIEQAIDGVTQVQVNEKTGLTFQTALRAFLRQDPDVMLVGEIRDHATASMAIEAAMTGHLVLSTLHTNDAASALWRLEKLGIQREPLASALTAVLAQRLIRTYCGVCHGTGCSHCHQTGLRGRMGVYEALCMNRHLRTSYAAGMGLEDWRQQLRSHGIASLMEQALLSVQAGMTPMSEVTREIPKD